MLSLLLLAALAAFFFMRRARYRPGPGASADAQARRIAGPAHRLLAALGYRTRSYRRAARWRSGADGERRTARLLAPLAGEGFAILHDRRLPRGNANVDHLVISPNGRVIMPDSKRWSAHYPLAVRNGRLMHGHWDVTDRLHGMPYEAATVAHLLGVPVTPLAIVHGARIPAGELHVDGVLIIPADQTVPVIRRLSRGTSPALGPVIATRAAKLLPPHTRTRP